jgi:hypothetical protein
MKFTVVCCLTAQTNVPEMGVAVSDQPVIGK